MILTYDPVSSVCSFFSVVNERNYTLKMLYKNNNSVFGQCIICDMQTHSQLVQHPCRVVEGWEITQSWQDSKCGHGGINLVLQHIFWAASFLSAGSGSAYRLTVYSAEVATVNDFPQERCLAQCWTFAFYHNCYSHVNMLCLIDEWCLWFKVAFLMTDDPFLALCMFSLSNTALVEGVIGRSLLNPNQVLSLIQKK